MLAPRDWLGISVPMRYASLALAFAFLTSCVDWPDIPASSDADAADWPSLLPVDEIGAPPETEDREQAIETLQNRAATLRARAEVLRRPVGDDEAMERLRQSLIR